MNKKKHLNGKCSNSQKTIIDKNIILIGSLAYKNATEKAHDV